MTDNPAKYLAILERSFKDVKSEGYPDIELSVLAGLNSHSEYWTDLALLWIENGYSINSEVSARLNELANSKSLTQRIRHRAFKITKRWQRKMKGTQSMKIQDVEITFKSWLELSTLKSFVFGQSFVKQKLSDNFKFEVQLNQANDDLAKGDFILYPEDDNKILFCDNYSEVEDILLRDGRIPAWVDISVYKYSKDYSLFRLICAGRFTDDTKELYYYKWGTGCFGIKSPDLPFGYKEGKKFKLRKVSAR